MTTETIEIVVTERGTRVVKRNLEEIGEAGTKASSGVNLLKNALAGLAIGNLVREFIRYADTFTTIQNRIRQVITDQKQLGVVTDELFRISQNTRQSFEATAELYSRLGTAGRTLGLSQRDLLNFTSSLNSALVVGNVNSQDAANGIRQLGQALGSGALRGDEFNSIAENIPIVLDVIAKKLNPSDPNSARAQIRKLAADGKLTADIIVGAFLDVQQEMEILAGQRIPTLAQAWTFLDNSITKSIGEMNTATGITRVLSEGLVFLANNMDTVIRVARILADVIGVTLAVKAVKAAISGLAALSAAALANPFTAIALAIAVAIAAVVEFADQMQIGGEYVGTVQDFIVAAWDIIGQRIQDFLKWFGENFGFISDFVRDIFGDVDLSFLGIAKTGANVFDTLVGIFRSMFLVIVAIFDKLPNAFYQIFTDAINGVITIVQRGLNGVAEAISAVTDFAGLGTIDAIDISSWKLSGPEKNGLEELGSSISGAIAEGMSFTGGSDLLNEILAASDLAAADRMAREEKEKREREAATDSLGAAGVPAATLPDDKKGSRKKTFADLIRDLEQENILLQMNNKEREIRAQIFEFENKLGRELSATEKERVTTLVEQNMALQDQNDELERIKGPMEDLQRAQTAINALYESGKISTDEYTRAMRELQIAMLEQNANGSFADGFNLQILKMGETLTNFAMDAGKLFGDVATSIAGTLGSAITDILLRGEDAREVLSNLATNVIGQLVQGLISLGIQYALNAALASAFGAAATEATVGFAGAAAAAWQPAAIAASIATYGAAAGIGLGAYTAAQAAGMALSAATSATGVIAGAGFADGGYTGDVGRNEVAGFVHGQEYVMNAQATAANYDTLEKMNNGQAYAGSEGSSPAQSVNVDGSVTIVNVDDPNRITSIMSSAEGQRIIVNAISSNRKTVGAILGSK